eukprot:10014590-Ditylum_brightwellii.AAC.1
MAFLISALSVLLLLNGVKERLLLFNASNITPFIPVQFGLPGEATNPSYNLPRAILYSLGIVTA